MSSFFDSVAVSAGWEVKIRTVGGFIVQKIIEAGPASQLPHRIELSLREFVDGAMITLIDVNAALGLLQKSGNDS